jgi:hypothetical protein
MVKRVHQDLEQPRAAICARRKPMKRFPRLEIHLLHSILSPVAITNQPGGCSEKIGQMRQCSSFEFLWARSAHPAG